MHRHDVQEPRGNLSYGRRINTDGLAFKVGSGIGTLVAFSTQPGNVALDGKGRNSPYTAALLKHLGTPGADITRDLVKVRNEVLATTNGKQVPWENSSLTGEVVLVPEDKAPNSGSTAQKPLPAQNNRAVELAYWDSIKSTESIAYYKAYLKKWPDGAFASIAQIRVRELEQKAENVTNSSVLKASKEAAVAAAKLRAEELAAAKRKATDIEARLFASETEKAALAKAVEEAQAKAQLALAEQKRKLEIANATKTQSQINRSSDFPEKGETKIATLTPTTVEEVAPPVAKPKDDRELVRSIQVELNRLGCSAGRPDGLWGKGSIRGLRNYAKYDKAKLVSLDPSEALLDLLKDESKRICPLICRRGHEEKNGRCVAIQQQRSIDKGEKARKRKAVPRVSKQVKASPKTGGKTCGRIPQFEKREFGCLYKKWACGKRYLDARRKGEACD